MPVPPVPLPPNPFEPSELHVSYQRCLTLEAAAPGLKPHGGFPPSIVCARILGHLLRLAPAGSKGQERVQRDIASTTDNNGLMDLARNYVVYFVHPFQRHGLTPALSEDLSCPPSECARLYPMSVMQGTLDYHTARNAAMQRDDLSCMITGLSLRNNEGIFLEAVHIIPEGINKDIGEEGTKVWTMLSSFTDIDIPVELAGNHVHRLENILTLDYVCHRLFDELLLWLKPIEGLPNTYRVCVTFEDTRQRFNLPHTVTFSSTTALPLPNPTLLALHALCCEVASMSGAAEYIADLEERMNETTVLENDGSSVDLLLSALALVETS